MPPEWAALRCIVCHQGDREETLLLCETCDRTAHCECLDPPLAEVPAGDWFCPHCEADGKAAAKRAADARAPPPPPNSALPPPGSGEAKFVVERILSERHVGGRREFLVKWLHYSEAANTWEPAENFTGTEWAIEPPAVGWTAAAAGGGAALAAAEAAEEAPAPVVAVKELRERDRVRVTWGPGRQLDGAVEHAHRARPRRHARTTCGSSTTMASFSWISDKAEERGGPPPQRRRRRRRRREARGVVEAVGALLEPAAKRPATATVKAATAVKEAVTPPAISPAREVVLPAARRGSR